MSLPPLPTPEDQAKATFDYLGHVASGEGGAPANPLDQWTAKAFQSYAADAGQAWMTPAAGGQDEDEDE